MVTGDFESSGSSYEVPSLSPGTQYTIRVQASLGETSTVVTEQMYATSKDISILVICCDIPRLLYIFFFWFSLVMVTLHRQNAFKTFA